MSIEKPREEELYENMTNEELEELYNKLRLERIEAIENRMRVRNKTSEYNFLPKDLQDEWEQADSLPEEIQEKIYIISNIQANRREGKS